MITRSRLASWSYYTGAYPGPFPIQLREKLKDLEELTDKDDYYFLRFLRIRNFNVNLAQSMIKTVVGSVSTLT